MNPIQYIQLFADPKSTWIPLTTLNAISSLLDGGKYTPKKYSFSSVPEQFKACLDTIKSQVSADGYDAEAATNFLFAVSVPAGVAIVATVLPPSYDSSTVQYIGFQSNPQPDYAALIIGKLFNFNGQNYGNLIISVKDEGVPIFITGSTPELGMWNGVFPIPLTLEYSKIGLFWQINIPVIIGKGFEYKLLKGSQNWESGSNRSFTPTIQNDGISLTYND